jgi:hypothetical protein
MSGFEGTVRPLLIKLMPYAPFYLMDTVASYALTAIIAAVIAVELAALAVDSPNVAWHVGLAEAKGHWGRLLVVFGLVTVPMVFLTIALTWVPITLPTAIHPIPVAEIILAVTVYAATASRVYRQRSGQGEHG